MHLVTPEGIKVRVYTGKGRYAIARRIVPAPTRPDDDLEMLVLYKDTEQGEAQARETLRFLQTRHPKEEYFFEDFFETATEAK